MIPDSIKEETAAQQRLNNGPQGAHTAASGRAQIPCQEVDQSLPSSPLCEPLN